MNLFQLAAAYNANKDRIEHVKDLGGPLLTMWLERGDELNANIKALVQAFGLTAPKIENAAQYDVEWVQNTLNDAGIPCQVTGEYDAQTQAAVKAFQTQHHSEPDGWVGPLTAELLERVK